MKKKSKHLMLCLVMLCSTTLLFAQKVITGKVVNAATGQGLQGVSVAVKGTSTATQTLADGSYSIQAPSENSRLVFTSIGFTNLEVAANAANSVSLTSTETQLEDVVVVAYGTKKRGDLTGAVTSVSAKDFQKGNINSSEQLLQGKVAGLEVTTGGGSAGGGSKIRIRGTASLNASNDPLIVIDGVPVEGNGIRGSANLLSTINPNDIASMSVLKDASAAALYGSRATNGVIIITTKKGTSKKFTYNFNTRVSLSDVANNKADVLNANQVREIVNANGTAEYKGFLGTANTDWQDLIYQKAMGTENNVSAAGIAQIGSKVELPLRASVGYLSQEGILRTNKFDRLSTSLNLSPKFFNNHLSFNVNAKYSNAKNRFADGGAIGSAVSFDPTQNPYSGSSKFGGYYEWLSGTSLNTLATRNPLALLNLRDNRSNVDRFIGNVQIDYKLHFFPDLHVLVNLGTDRSTGSGTDIQDSSSASSILGLQGKGRIGIYEEKKTSKLADVQLFYEKEIPSLKSKIDLLVGHSFQDFYTDNVNSFARFQTGAVDSSTKPNFPTDRNGFAIDSYLGRMNLSVNDKFLLTASIRRDASSRFAKANRVGYFPAVAAAWKIKETFFRQSNVLSELKLRAGLGETGNQDGIGYYTYLPVYGFGNQSAEYQFGDQFVRFLRPSAYDPSVKWETTQTANIGLDFGFLKDRITATIDVYEKKTRDLLSVVPVAAGANFNIELLKNVGNLTNRGAELTINTIPVKTKNVTWNLGFNIAYNETEVTKLIDYTDPNYTGIAVSGIAGGTGNNIGRISVGYAPFTFYPKRQVYNEFGKPIEGVYDDINRDGKVNGEDGTDRYFYKKPAPDAIFGINTAVNIKQFSLGLAGHGMLGNYLYNNFASNTGSLRNILNPVKHIGNASVNYLETRFANNRYNSDYYIQNASFFRLDNINIGYDLGKIARQKATLRLTANVQNVFVITKYKGTDPENAGSNGIDNNIYPRPRIYSVGASIDF